MLHPLSPSLPRPPLSTREGKAAPLLRASSMAASSSFLLSSFSPQTLTSKPQNPSSFLPTSFSSSSASAAASVTRNVSFALWSSFPSLRKSLPMGSGFVPKVTLSSELEQEDVEELSEGEAAAEFSPDLKLFVGNLPFSVDSAQLAGLFQRVGNVEMVEVIYDKLTGRSRGFGFVTMSSIEEAEAAAQQFNGYTLDGRMLRVNSGPPPRREEAPSRGFRSGGGGGGNGEAANRVYVGNLSWGVDNLALETLFSEQGKVLEAKVVYDRESGRSRGFGFVTYSSAEEADNAIASLNGADLDGRSIRVTVADPRPRRQF